MMKQEKKTLHLLKAAQVQPFMGYFSSLGTPTEKLASKTRFQLAPVLEGKGVVAVLAAWKMIDAGADLEGCMSLGYECANQSPIVSTSGFGGLHFRPANSLKQLLERFIEDVKSDSTASLYTLVHSNNAYRFVRQSPFGDEYQSWQIEQYMITRIIQIVRLCVSSDWLPDKLDISSSSRKLAIPKEWEAININWGAQDTGVWISEAVISQTIHEPESIQQNSTLRLTNDSTSLCFESFIKTQVINKQVGLENTAEEFGMSSSTLKILLSKFNTTYQELVENERYKLATRDLVETDKGLAIVAHDSGYGHATNFSRAFRRIAGITPSQYRLLARKNS
ncbi:MAG: hypothetical protein DRQ47_10435 [Gammaproteobacteria bacterium]|nr:MAG: hypothetical protein DRQ47_10435 [Gammaproteobacteria bacterium]